ncbi:MAG: aminoglycoside phosphotransferase family protein [Planctomycetota bacterium]
MQHGRQPPPEHEDPSDLAHALEPALREQLAGALRGEIEWFRATWQRGGAATGSAQWFDKQSGQTIPVVIKLPVGGSELIWTTALGKHGFDRDIRTGQTPFPTPRVIASGDVLGGYDLGWLVIERLEGTPVSGDLSEDSLEGLLRAATVFQQLAADAASRQDDPLPGKTDSRDWGAIVEQSREVVRDAAIEDIPAWVEALRKVHKSLPHLLADWSARPVDDWCHGDLHPGNAIHMPGDPGHPDRCVLIDLGLVHKGHWIEDAVYLERVFWGHDDRLLGVKPVRRMRALRREMGLPLTGDDGRLANIKRVLTAAAVPARFAAEGGDAAYHAAALGCLHRLLDTV